MGRIESYFISYHKNVEREDRFKLFTDLYNKILYKDDVWHFFYEGKYDELRFHSKFKRRVDKFLDNDERVYQFVEKEGGWVDDHKIVDENKEYFTAIFHQNSLATIKLSQREDINNRYLQNFMDRVVHSFFDMFFLTDGRSTLEVEIMKDYLVDRAFYFGMMWQQLKNNKENNDGQSE